MPKDIIAFWGYVAPESVKKYKEKYPNASWVDLDVGFGYPESKILPEACCKIIKNIFDNAFYLKDRIIKILAPVGKDKCDNGFFAANILRDFGFDVEMFYSEGLLPRGKMPETPICVSNIPLKSKMEIITAQIITPYRDKIKKCAPRFGFWGVPPHDLSILEMFPNETHVYGWTRCVEAGYPADIELEMFVNKGIPTVFYTQTFCAKSQLAKYLANKYGGLYIDVDGLANNSTRAKIEAFLKLR